MSIVLAMMFAIGDLDGIWNGGSINIEKMYYPSFSRHSE